VSETVQFVSFEREQVNVVRRCSLQISAWTPAVLTNVSHGFP
jgi:hypothetical protein